jgi:hypothetical protein
MYISERKKIYDTVYEYKDGFGLWCLTPLSTIFHLKYKPPRRVEKYFGLLFFFNNNNFLTSQIVLYTHWNQKRIIGYVLYRYV